MFLYILMVFALVFLTEAITEIVIKSVIFKPIRKRVSKIGFWAKELLSCGYCFSFWVAWGLTIASGLFLPLTSFYLVNSFCLGLIVHRLSNILHNVIDKWTDKYYNIGYINTDKSGE